MTVDGFSKKWKWKLSDDVLIGMKTAKQKPNYCTPPIVYGIRNTSKYCKIASSISITASTTPGHLCETSCWTHARAQLSRSTAARAKFKHLFRHPRWDSDGIGVENIREYKKENILTKNRRTKWNAKILL